MVSKLEKLCGDIRACRICEPDLPQGPNPVFRTSAGARVLIAGQAPGIRVHRSSVPFDDPSGDRLRQWMGVTSEVFYDDSSVAIVPMGFCYPGTGKSGDLPPRPECAKIWHGQLLPLMSDIDLTLVIGNYAQTYYLHGSRKKTLTDTVKNWQQYAPAIIPLPHPSPRNNIWFKRNPWFETELLPVLKERVASLLAT